jgi:uncharacterized coiled-coil protein SlyX
MSSESLQLHGDITAGRVRLAALEAEVAHQNAELDRVKHALRTLQARYLDEIGSLYARLNDLEAAIIEAEIAAGLRPPPAADGPDTERDDANGESGAAGDASGAAASCGRAAPSADLKRMFRHLAKTIHPDLARDGQARFRRHSLMAEANRAYAERDEDRLRLILHRWEQSPESVIGDDAESETLRLRRRITALEEHAQAIAAEMADLRTSAIWRLNEKIADARRQGWDLFAEMVREVRRETQRATARLAKLKRRGGPIAIL